MADKKLGIHWQERGNDMHFHFGSGPKDKDGYRKVKIQTMPRQQFYQQFPKEPYHGIKEPKWAEWLDKNDKACAAFIKKYGG